MLPSDEATIKEADQMHRKSTLSAMRSTGWRRSVHLWFARFFDHVGNELRECQYQEMRGKDDKYHDEY